ncbi:FCD domain-containing protein [Paenirhodobacter populi]|uniref:GntR family transcriptional regulator n=1 Tax=Paenirhodobacter populi TaxID=2306993 RepID=A0A443IN57_9RHOB|nr:GntR family transcriptional regulator [Sinirhodobacter populi]
MSREAPQFQDNLGAASSPRSIRLAGEFHTLLAEQAGSPLLADFVNATVARTSLILARYGRPHLAECGIDEHVQLIEALKKQDRTRAMEIMDRHLHAVEDRAYAEEAPQADISAILSRYVGTKD